MRASCRASEFVSPRLFPEHRSGLRVFGQAEAAWPEDEYETGQQQCLQLPLGLALPPSPRRRRVAVAHGFSLHADTAVHGNDRQGLERLARYGARGPVAESRLKSLDDGRYQYTPKKGVSFTVTAQHFIGCTSPGSLEKNLHSRQRPSRLPRRRGRPRSLNCDELRGSE